MRIREQNRDRVLERLNAIRRHRMSDSEDEDEVNRQYQLPISDLPPAYSNLAFEGIQ